jgi:hypothetical protein
VQPYQYNNCVYYYNQFADRKPASGVDPTPPQLPLSGFYWQNSPPGNRPDRPFSGICALPPRRRPGTFRIRLHKHSKTHLTLYLQFIMVPLVIFGGIGYTTPVFSGCSIRAAGARHRPPVRLEPEEKRVCFRNRRETGQTRPSATLSPSRYSFLSLPVAGLFRPGLV